VQGVVWAGRNHGFTHTPRRSECGAPYQRQHQRRIAGLLALECPGIEGLQHLLGQGLLGEGSVAGWGDDWSPLLPGVGRGDGDIRPRLHAVGLCVAEREPARKLFARWMPSEQIMLVH
jgi:hypothetical protein